MPLTEYPLIYIYLLVNVGERLIQIYHCFCDETRLRILNLLCQGPLCVCHFQELLDESQVKISKHLSYLKRRQLVEAVRYQNWMIYRLPEQIPDELALNLKCLQDCVQTESIFKRDLQRLANKVSKEEWPPNALACAGITPFAHERTSDSDGEPCCE